ncbi:hypothetical protein QBC44DRAFT_29490 [Cladorrhinum sp. PSN332]|nr:hypothetical protein QBC44DRAFT_29490 [Cladorrhinum sp. PSN332]
MAPSFVPGIGKQKKDVVVIWRKNSVLHSLAVVNGVAEWATVVAPSVTAGGGMSWGIATNSSWIYFTEINNLRKEWRPLPANNTVIYNSAFGSPRARWCRRRLRYETSRLLGLQLLLGISSSIATAS